MTDVCPQHGPGCHVPSHRELPPAAPRPAYRLAYLDPADPRRAFTSPYGSGATRDEALAPIRNMIETSPTGTPLVPHTVLVDLDVLATDPEALELALRTDPALVAICRTVGEQARADERGRWVDVVSAIDRANAARAAKRQARADRTTP